MIFPLGKQKLANTNQDNQIQSINLCNGTYFSKKVYAVYNGVWGKPQKLSNFREFLC